MLKPGKSPSMNGLVSNFLIETADFICKPLALIYQKSMKSSMVPKDWKKGNITESLIRVQGTVLEITDLPHIFVRY